MRRTAKVVGAATPGAEETARATILALNTGMFELYGDAGFFQPRDINARRTLIEAVSFTTTPQDVLEPATRIISGRTVRETFFGNPALIPPTCRLWFGSAPANGRRW